MIRWNEERLEELVRKMGLRRTPGQGKTPIHLSLYGTSPWADPLLTKIMRLDTNAWSALGYTETDQVSVIRYLGSLGCQTDWVLQVAIELRQPLALALAEALIEVGGCNRHSLLLAVQYQQPLAPDLAKLLIEAGAFDKNALTVAARFQCPLIFELAKLLIDAGCDPVMEDDNGWDVLVRLAWYGYPVDPQVTDLFLSAGCRANLIGRSSISDETCIRFDQILKEHAEWKEARDCLLAEHFPTGSSVDWDR